ncbi:hypothetical protein HPB51_006716 [Rhipicephalus microplus]|uniref:Uncharacterized protein n=1 Tax=Rhipicephalus microplus TaxID=6941 RepID=A0A9J6E7T6_RHIMP|nr:hypothetical protein HPB51_006716 [Rhipicephalus microplus]
MEAERSETKKIAHKLYVVKPHEAYFNETQARADVPAVFSPDVFIISDYEHSKQFTTIKKFLNYILVFFNGWGRDTYEVMYGKDMIAEYTLNNFQSYIETRLSEFVGADAVMLLTGMGCSHDQAAPVPNIPGNRGAYHCLWSEGYIMSYEVTDERQFAFSSCSQEQFLVFIRVGGEGHETLPH